MKTAENGWLAVRSEFSWTCLIKFVHRYPTPDNALLKAACTLQPLQVSFGNACGKDIKLYLTATWQDTSWRQNLKSWCLQGTINSILIIACVFSRHFQVHQGNSTTECWKLISASARQVAKNWKNVLRLCARLQFDLWKPVGWWSLLWFGKLEQWSRKNNMEVCNKHPINHVISTNIDDRWFIYCQLIILVE